MLITKVIPAACMSLGVGGDTLVNEPGGAVLGQSWRELKMFYLPPNHIIIQLIASFIISFCIDNSFCFSLFF